MKTAYACAALLWLAGCGGSSKPPQTASTPPAKVDNGGVKESDLPTVHLTPEAEKRLGIETAEASIQSAARRRTFAGEVVIPAGKTIAVQAPITGTLQASETPIVPGNSVAKGDLLFTLLPVVGVQRDLHVSVVAEVDAARARVEAARLRATRADEMLKDKVGSVRALETAQEELKVAQAVLQAAQARRRHIEQSPLEADVTVRITAPSSGILRQLLVAPGQMVQGGTLLAEIAGVDTIWIRVPIYAGELAQLDTAAAAEVRPINATTGSALLLAVPVTAPPTANALSVSADLYYQAPNRAGLRPGESVNAAIALRGAHQFLAIPWSAVVHDYQGGAWVYTRTAPQTYARRRVQIRQVENRTAFLSHGLEPGARVVTAGAAELFGTEFGPGK